VIGLRLRGRHALFPPKGEEEKSKGELGRHASQQPSEAAYSIATAVSAGGSSRAVGRADSGRRLKKRG
jgi:hypothetical protein